MENTLSWKQKIIRNYSLSTYYGEMYCFPVLLLIIRIWIAKVFWLSGLTKLSSWSATLFLFKNEYNVPLIPYEMAAYMAVFTELFFPILIVIGLATRLSVIPLIIMALVIHLSYDMKAEHIYWWLLLFTILFYGPGKLSLDYWLKKKYDIR